MRAITKGKEPRELEQYRCKPDAVYDGSTDFTDVKDAIRKQLLEEQGHLCAYCMSRLPIDLEKKDFSKMKVEHWHCQENYSAEQLNYHNMLGVCKGNEGCSPENQTCDTRRAYFQEKYKKSRNTDLKYNPSNPVHSIEERIRFLGDGKIKSDDSEFDCQLNEMLNLNFTRLIKNRKGVQDAVYQVLSTKFSMKPGSRKANEKISEIDKLYKKWSTPDKEGRLHEYCAVAIYFLKEAKAKLDK